jgi:hypothetical protein
MNDQLLGVLLGGLIATNGGLLVALITEIRSRREWRRQAQLGAAKDAMLALQAVNREIMNLAITDSEWADDGKTEAWAALHAASIRWHGARYGAALISPKRQIDALDALDVELDRLLGIATSGRWDQSDFRRERARLGALGAAYVRLVRESASEGAIEWSSLWTWSVEAKRAEHGANHARTTTRRSQNIKHERA